MLLKELISETGYCKIVGDVEGIDVTGIEYNSSKIAEGFVFVAVKGFKTDGHKYIDSAIEKGAVAVVVEDERDDIGITQIVYKDTRKALALLSSSFFGKPQNKLKLVGVTGTNGKTTVTYLVKTILERQGHKVGLIGTNQNMVGNMALKSKHTTPESRELYELFSIMVREGVEYVVMEISSHSLELNRIYGCEFEVGAFTNLTQDHLDFHITMENYVKAKSKLFKMCRYGFVNADDKYLQSLICDSTADMDFYGIKSDKGHKAEKVVCSEKGVDFVYDGCDIHLPIPGKFSVYNAMCAIGMCNKLGISTEECALALKEVCGVKGRAEVVDIPSEYTVMIDYAHTPDGVENIINAVKGFCKGRIITLFGCGGDRDRTKRPIMGRIAGELSDMCVVTSDNPRTEDPRLIIDDIIEGISQTGVSYDVVVNRKEAIDHAMDIAQKGDIVLLLGKGHETYQILNNDTIDFDERKIVRELFEKKQALN